VNIWQDQAACTGIDSFIARGGTAEKKAVCAQCPVNTECLKFAISNEDFEATVYGGFTGEERKQLVKDGFVL
jgi:WhiB family redox-sensing transcriptional regulator